MSARTLTKPIRRSYAAMIAGLASTVSLGQALLLKATYQSPPDARGPREGIERRRSMTFSASRGKVVRHGDSSSQIALASMGAMECTVSENPEEPVATSKHPLSVLDEDPEVERHKILVIGDSLVSGVGGASSFRHTVPNGPALPRHVARYLSELLNVDVHWNALSLTGGDVRMLRKKVIPMLKREKERQANGTGSTQNMFSAVVVVTGFNDIKRISPVRTAKKFREDLESFIDQIREEVGKSCDIFLPSIPGVHHAPRFHEPLRSILIFLTNLWDAQKIALARRMKNVHFVGNPPEEAWTNNPIQFFSTLDRIHPSELGYEHWGERIAKDISRALKKSVEFGRLSAAKISDATSDAVHRVGEAASKAVAGTASIAEKTSSAVASNSTKGAEGLANCLKE